MEETAEVSHFFSITDPPNNFEDTVRKITAFITEQHTKGRRVALVTCGGTTVPLERNTVRYLDNFSGGGRGSASAEYFLAHGYAVLFLHRRHSLQPFARHFLQHQENNFLDYLMANKDTGAVEVKPMIADQVSKVLQKHNKALEDGLLMKVIFQSIHEYLFLLRASACALHQCGPEALIFSAAAVSDYYIPSEQMAQHKIQSQGPLTVTFQPVPKMLGSMRTTWSPEAYVASFKLETDPAMLDHKVEKSLESYGQQLVIGNLLSNHKDQVVLYSQGAPTLTIVRSTEDIKQEVDIEDKLVAEVVKRHTAFMKDKKAN